MDRPRPVCMCGCGEFIPEEKIRHEGRKRIPKFYDRDHMLKWRKESGFYSSFSRLGWQAQAELAEKLGEWPGNEKRRGVLDQVRNRAGRKTGRHDMSKPSYYSVSYLERKTIYTQAGQERIVPDWFILVGPCATREEAEVKGKERVEKLYPLSPVSPQFERDTLFKNLTVVSKSQLRQYKVEV